MASRGTNVRHTGSLAADWEGKPRRYLLCVTVPVSHSALLWAQQLQQLLGVRLEPVCIGVCGRRNKPSASPEDVPQAHISEDVPPELLYYVGSGWPCSLLLAGAECWHLPWPSTPALALGKLPTVYPEAGNSPWDSHESQNSWEINSNF